MIIFSEGSFLNPGTWDSSLGQLKSDYHCGQSEQTSGRPVVGTDGWMNRPEASCSNQIGTVAIRQNVNQDWFNSALLECEYLYMYKYIEKKLQVVVNLLHWQSIPLGLAFTSCLKWLPGSKC